MRFAINLPLFNAFAQAGATWWMEGFWWNDTPDIARQRIRHGPPRL